MALEKSRFFDSVGDDRVYQADQFAEYFRTFLTDGIFNGGDNLKVTAPETGMQVRVDYGMAMIQGYAYWLEDDGKGEFILQVPAADTLPRIDRVILRLNRSLSERKISLAISTGVAAAVPVPPDLTKTANIYELSLAQIAVAPNALKIIGGDILDERLNSDVCGMINSLITLDTKDWYQIANKTIDDLKNQGYLPLAGGTMQGSINMDGKKLSGVPLPSAPDDTASKAYVDGYGYTKTESDAKYSSVGASYTKAESDEKYPLKGDSYTKAVSDGRYATAAQGVLAVNALPKSGGTMAGAINMGGNAVSNLPDPTDEKDAVTKKYVDDNTTANALNSNTPNAEEADPNTFMGGIRLTKHANCPTNEYYYIATVKYTDNCRCQFAVRYTDGAILASRSCYSSESDTVNWRPWTCYKKPVISTATPSGSGLPGQLWIQY